MTLVHIDILDNDRGGHDDLLVSIGTVTGDLKLDTYYFALEIEPKFEVHGIKVAVACLLEFWVEKINQMVNSETIYLPIDFSDEYTGCLQVNRIDNELELKYGLSRREGYSVDPINPHNYYKEIDDFSADSERVDRIEREILVNSIQDQIRKLKNAR